MPNIFSERVVCIQSVIMQDTGAEAFTLGKIYPANFNSTYIRALNNNDEVHELGRIYDEDEFYTIHFVKIID